LWHLFNLAGRSRFVAAITPPALVRITLRCDLSGAGRDADLNYGDPEIPRLPLCLDVQVPHCGRAGAAQCRKLVEQQAGRPDGEETERELRLTDGNDANNN
jgi:hypothetical protein